VSGDGQARRDGEREVSARLQRQTDREKWEGERSFGSEARSNKEKILGYMTLMQKAHHFEAMKPI
jgi:hypothetical protein